MIGSVWALVGLGVLVVVLVMAATAVWAGRVRRASVVDVSWGLGFVAVALVTSGLGDGDPLRRALLVLLTALWGGRLGWHVFRRSAGGGHAEDPRYEELLSKGQDSPAPFSLGRVVRRVLLPQGVAMAVVSLPLAVGAAYGDVWWPVVGAGAAVWAIGLAFEAIGDAQLAAYKSKPREKRPRILDTGLWGWTRHPNYFGDACVWWGLWLIGGLASGWLPGLATIVAPIAMTYFLRNVTGAALLERTMSQRDGWAEYAARVPMFFPRPPRDTRKGSTQRRA